MKQGLYTILNQYQIAPQVFRMELLGDTSALTAPGQFVNMALPGFYLRRPISVCNWDETGISLVYKVVGQGTHAMSSLPAGSELDLLVGLGNGFDPDLSGDKPLLVGGGVGVPPLLGLARVLREQGKEVRAILGFNTSSELILLRDFHALGVEVAVTTVDGSMGKKGFVTAALPEEGQYSYTYACGPEPMLKALWDQSATSGQYSFEQRMACGFGACMGCSCQTKYGNKRICKDGPVLTKEEIIW